ncbi:hypothetical protein ACHWQZ_G012099 [Mnemiopsis leidyi]
MRSEPQHSFSKHGWQVSSAQFSSCSTYLATGSWDKSAVVYNVLDLKPLFRLSVAHSLPVTCVRWLNRDLVTCSADRCAALWDTSNGERSTLFSGHTGWVMSCDTTDNNITTTSWDGTLGLWDASRSSPIQLMSGHVAGVWDCATLKSSQVIASASEDCTLRLWDRRTASSFSTLAGGHDDSVLSVCWPADGQFLLASGSTDCNILLWDTRTCKAVTKVESHTDSVKELVPLPHQPGVIASVGDNSLKIWDTSDATNIKLLGSRSFPTDLECVAVSPDRLTHVCGGVNSTTYLSLFVGVDDDAHADLSSKYKDSINRLSEEDSNKIFGFSRPAQPTKQSDIPAQYIPRDPGSPSRGASHDVTSVDSVTSSYSVTSIPPPTDAELSSMISPISISPVSEEGCKRESSCSDSGVDVTSLSIC